MMNIVFLVLFVIAVIKMLSDHGKIEDLERQLKGKEKDVEQFRYNQKTLEEAFVELSNELADLKEKYVRPRGKNGRFTK